MTAEEARRILIDIADQMPSDVCADWIEALRMAIQALEAQPCEEDFVKHKKEVLERIAKREREIDKYIKELETLKQQPCEDCISRKSVRQKLQENYDFFVNAYGGFGNLPQSDKPRVDEIDNCIAIVVNEPPVIPQMKKGRWIDVLDEKTEYSETHHFECSICGCGSHWIHELEKFCPNCGAEMKGKENEDSN